MQKKMQSGGKAAEKKAAASEYKNKPKAKYGSNVSMKKGGRKK